MLVVNERLIIIIVYNRVLKWYSFIRKKEFVLSKKWKRRLYQLLALIIGLTFGYFDPITTQRLLPLLGISVGIGYLLISQSYKDFETSGWFLLIQMFMYFLIGGAISSTITFSMQFMQQ